MSTYLVKRETFRAISEKRTARHGRREPDAVGYWRGWAAVKSDMTLDTFFFPCRLVGPDLCGSVFEWIYMNHPSTGLRNESSACLLTL
jgi:hypothetical protein